MKNGLPTYKAGYAGHLEENIGNGLNTAHFGHFISYYTKNEQLWLFFLFLTQNCQAFGGY